MCVKTFLKNVQKGCKLKCQESAWNQLKRAIEQINKQTVKFLMFYWTLSKTNCRAFQMDFTNTLQAVFPLKNNCPDKFNEHFPNETS